MYRVLGSKKTCDVIACWGTTWIHLSPAHWAK